MTLEEMAAIPLAQWDAELERRCGMFATLFPDSGSHRRELYQRHMEFFAAGAQAKERLFMAANRVGKSMAGAYEVTCHLTGLYPHWWTGKRFDGPCDWWACGTNTETTRDIVQAKLMGPSERLGTGMIPKALIVDTTRRQGVPGALETIWIRHVSGGTSKIGLKTYEQGRKSFEGTEKSGIWDDEEPPEDIYTEQLYRTITTRGITLITFTPLQGMSGVVKSFLEVANDEARAHKFYVQAGWADCPHLSEEEKAIVVATTPKYQARARIFGEPSLGAGAVYPFEREIITVQPFDIPPTWPRAFGMDVGWQGTAVVWAAMHPGTGVHYVYDEYFHPGERSDGAASNHAVAIRGRGKDIPGAIDPASAAHQLTPFADLGLQITPANNSVELGIMETFDMFATGRLKIFANCSHLLQEFNRYHRDEKGRIVKVDDHCLDALRYYVMTGRNVAKIPAQSGAASSVGSLVNRLTGGSSRPSWMG